MTEMYLIGMNVPKDIIVLLITCNVCNVCVFGDK